MSKVLAAIEALAHNVTHPRFVSEALEELHAGYEDLKQRIESLEGHKPEAEPAAAPAAAAAPETPAPGAPAVPPVAA